MNTDYFTRVAAIKHNREFNTSGDSTNRLISERVFFKEITVKSGYLRRAIVNAIDGNVKIKNPEQRHGKN